jgi:hypothetical protein
VFNLGARRDLTPDSAEFYGDAFLLARGITVAALGWQFDVAPGGAALHFSPPPAGAPGTITGLVRSDVTIDDPTRTISLGHTVGASRAAGYPVADPDASVNTLPARDDPTGPRRTIPRSVWRFAREEAGGAIVDDPRAVYMADGFLPGKIYEVVYLAKDPVVVGTGMAAVRDFVSYLKHDPATPAPTRYAVAYGVSQTGRFLRHFLSQGFNTDEEGRKALDGIFSHTAGAGRGSFNHRFAQPSRDAQPYTTFFYPTDVFPFSSVEETDSVTGARGSLLANAGDAAHLPKVFYVDGGYEYWGRAASLTHTTVDGRTDLGFTPTERRYVIASAQHSSPAPFPPPATARDEGQPSYRGNVLDQRLVLRALMAALCDWVSKGVQPPPSRYPTVAQMVRPADVEFPTIPGVAMAHIPAQPYRVDYGPRWKDGIIDIEPPHLGKPYTVLVPKVDAIGNDAVGIRTVELRVPLATYFPWHLRPRGAAGSDRLVSFTGTFIPLPRTEAERRETRDSRDSIERRYGSRNAFLARVDEAAKAMVSERVLLPQDVAAARARMAETWDWIAGQR